MRILWLILAVLSLSLGTFGLFLPHKVHAFIHLGAGVLALVLCFTQEEKRWME